MSQSFSKIWIVIIILAAIGGGIFAWQYFGTIRKEAGVQILPSFENISLADRKVWKEKLSWSDECERSFEATHSGVMGENGFLSIHQLTDSLYLANIICAGGAYQPENVFEIFRVENGQLSLHYTPIFTEFQEQQISGLATFNKEEKTLSIWSRSRGLGDCGTYAVYDFDSKGKPVLQEYRIRECSDANEFLAPESWPLWQTYRNEEYGLEVKYPNDWFVQQNEFSNNTIEFGESFQIYVDGKKEIVKKIGLTVKIFGERAGFIWPKATGVPSLEEFVYTAFFPIRPQPESTLKEGESVEPIVFGVGNYEGLLVKLYKEVGITKLIPRVFTQTNGTIYELEGEVLALQTANLPTAYNYEEVFNQILATFRFIK